ncbi:MAG: hypothetical protein KAI72_01030, partial [Candidatus Pacebacteria bacterium]|nr:hypothetical protein [Candidatus Paceibacterota bacterium]
GGTVDAPDVTFTSPVTVSKGLYILTIASGTTIPLGDSPTTTGITNNGTITAGTGTWICNGNLTNNNTVTTSLTAMDVSHTYANGAGSSLTMTGSTFSLGGLTVTSGSTFPANPTVTFDGSSNTTVDAPDVTFNSVTFNKTSGYSMTISGTVVVAGTLTLTNGATNTGTIDARGDINIASTFDQGSAAMTFSGTNAQTVTLTADKFPTGAFTVNKSSGTATTSGTLTIVGATTIQEGTLSLEGSTNFNGNITVEDGGTLSCATGGTTITIDDADTMTVDSGGTFNLQGASGNLITLQSDTIAAWSLIMNGSHDMDYIDVSYSDASGGDTMYAYSSTDSLNNNTNWVISGGAVMTWDGSESSDWATGANWVGDTAPTSTDGVIIDGSYTNTPMLDLTSGTTTINSLSLGATAASMLTLSNGNSTTNKLVVTGDVNIGTSGTLTHTANTTAQTHTINLEAVNFIIASGGTINVNARGFQPSAGLGVGGYGAGGGYGGDGSPMPGAGAGGSAYGSIIEPSNLGSGGGNSAIAGGAGGGAVKIIVTGTTTISGTITANGANGGGAGSGGSIWIDTGVFAGDGTFSVNGGTGLSSRAGGGGGRIAVHYTTDSSSVSYQAYAGGPAGLYGGAGTIYTKSSSQTYGNLFVNNNSYSGQRTPLLTSDWTFDNITISGAGKFDTNEYNLTINSALTINSNGVFNLSASSNVIYSTLDWSSQGIIIDNGGTFVLLSGGGDLIIPATATLYANTARTFTGLTVNGTLTHSNNATVETYKINYTINGDMVIASGGTINVNARGFGINAGPGAGGYAAGGAYGGDGGIGSESGGSAYGSITEPSNLGSGGGSSKSVAGTGGGAVKIIVTGSTTVFGTITANGKTVSGSGGSGGSIWIDTGVFAGDGTFSVNGGNGVNSGHGGGGGGRIAVHYTTDSSTVSYQAYGGGPAGRYGGAGTIYTKSSSQTYGNLFVNNNSYSGQRTPLLTSDWTFDNITISGAGKFDANGYNLTINADFNNTGTFTHSSQTVTFADAGQVSHIYGDTTFNNLTCVTVGKALQFEATKTTTITGALTFTGQSGSLITLRSTADDTQWLIDPQGTRSVSYVDVKDSNNVHVMAISPDDSVDSLNNINWEIGATIIWDGSESSDWTVGANWIGDTAPTLIDDVIIDGNYDNAPTLDLTSGTTTINSLSLGATAASMLTLSNGNSTTNKLVVMGDVNIGTSGTLTHTANTTAQTHVINLEAANLTVASDGTINVNAKGYQYSEGSGEGINGDRAGGAGYGGDGGDGNVGAGGLSYGSIIEPIDLGSGGGNRGSFDYGGAGAGAVKLTITGTTTIAGTISSNGANGEYHSGGGSGGSVWINTGILAGGGSISANGGSGSDGYCGGAGGGRIAMH